MGALICCRIRFGYRGQPLRRLEGSTIKVELMASFTKRIGNRHVAPAADLWLAVEA